MLIVLTYLSLIIVVPHCPLPCPNLASLLLSSSSKLSSSLSSRWRCHPHPHHSIILSSSWPGCIIYIYIFVVRISAQTMVSHFPRAPPTRRTSLPYSPKLQTPIFGWLLCGNWFVCGCLRPWCISFSFFFVAQFLSQQWYHISHTPPARRTSPPCVPLLWTPFFGWLLCEPLSIRGPSTGNGVFHIYIFSSFE